MVSRPRFRPLSPGPPLWITGPILAKTETHHAPVVLCDGYVCG